MNLLREQAQELLTQLKTIRIGENVRVGIAPPFVYLPIAADILVKTQILLGAQNVHPQPKGAYTGEVSAPQLQSVGVDFVLVGHSERRNLFQEDHDFLAEKVRAVLQQSQVVIFCVGEPLFVREAGKREEFVMLQLVKGLGELSVADMGRVIIAYEPIWAIGTGQRATTADIDSMHGHLRAMLKTNLPHLPTEQVPLLYGGSVQAQNAAEILALDNVDGVLVGGGSLSFEEFERIIRLCD